MAPGLVIVNPHASRVRDAATRERVKAELAESLIRRDGRAPEIVETKSPDEVAGLLDQARASYSSCVVGVGGDGTMRQLAAGLRGSGIPLGIVPAGTGNQVGAVLGIPRSLDGGAKMLATAHPRTVDLGEVTVHTLDGPTSPSTFIIGCGAGFDAELMATTPGDLKRRIGTAAYLVQAVKLGIRIRTRPFRITVDDRTIRMDASIAVVGNMGQLIPGKVDLRLPIDPADGLLDLIAVGARGPLHGLKGMVHELLRTELGGEDGATNIRLQGRQIRVEPGPKTPVEIDGDHVGEGSLETRVLPGALQVLVP